MRIGSLDTGLRVSLALNLALAVLLIILYIKARGAPPTPLALDQSGWLHQPAADGFAQIPSEPGATVFLGDSLIAEGPWAEFFSKGPVLNRGVKGDTVAGVRERLREVTDRSPGIVYLLIGTNDLSRGRTPEAVATDLRTLAEELHQGSPSTRARVLALLPTTDAARNREIGRVNLLLREAGLELIDTQEALADANGRLRAELTYDGLHLNARGYVALCEAIKGE